MKPSKIIIPILLAIGLSALVVFIGLGYIDLSEIFGRGRSLEIDYLVDGKYLDDGENLDESLLAALRRKKSEERAKKDEKEDIELIEENSDKSLSPWERMLLENQKRNSTEGKKKEKKDFEENVELGENTPANSFEEQILKSRERSKNQTEEFLEKKKNDKNTSMTPEEKAYIEAKYEKDLEEYKRQVRQKEKEKKNDKKKKEEIAENIVTLSIACHTAVNKGMHKQPEFRGIVPPSGVILSPVKIKISEGQTVLDALIKAQEDYKFSLKYRGSGPRAYIESINRLEEFDGGKDSGWMYSVNGWYPDYGAGSYILKGGDKIEWNYTCEGLGADLGEVWK